ncbi:hypothetical protein ACG7TL_009126 [Trametes sanguinea]
MAPTNQTSDEITKPNSRQPHIILLTLPPSSFTTPTQSLRVRFSVHTNRQDKLYRMDRPPSSHTFGHGGRTTSASSSSLPGAREVQTIMDAQAHILMDISTIRGDVDSLKGLKSKVDNLELKVVNLEIEVTHMGQKLNRLEAKVETLDGKVEGLDRKMDQVLAVLSQLQVGGRAGVPFPNLPAPANTREGGDNRGSQRQRHGSTITRKLSDLARSVLGGITDQANKGLNELNALEQQGAPEEGDSRYLRPTADPSRAGTSRASRTSQVPPPLYQQIQPDRDRR